MSELYQVVSSERDNFTMVPNIIFEYPDLSHTAFRLYVWYRKVCGSKNDDGKCWMSLKSLGKKCRMDRRTVIAARDKLEELGLIEVKRSPESNGSLKIIITLVDIWDLNRELQNNNSVDKRAVQNNNSYSTKQQLVQVQNNNSIKIPLNNTKEQDSDAVPKRTARFDQSDFSLGKGKGFLLDKNKKTKPKDFPDKAVHILHDELSKRRKIMRKPNLNKWASTVRKFLNETDCTEDEFKNVLSWYIQHVGEEFIPQAYSAESFCTNFVRLRDKMERNIEQEGEYIPPVFEETQVKTIVVEFTEEERIQDCLKRDRNDLGLNSEEEYEEYITEWEEEYNEKYVCPYI